MVMILQVILLIVVLAAMGLSLVAIGNLSDKWGYENPEQTRLLREEVEEEESIISRNSAFNYLFVRHQNNTSKGPDSRKL